MGRHLEDRAVRAQTIGGEVWISRERLCNADARGCAGERGANAADDANEFVAQDNSEQVTFARVDFTVAIARFHDGRGADRQRGVGHDEHDVVEKNVRVENAELKSARGEDRAIGQASEGALNRLGAIIVDDG